MCRRNYFLTIIMSLVAGFAGQMIYVGLVSPRAAEARAGDDESRLQWEYCAVTKAQFATSPRGGAYWIAYFRSNGNVDVVTVETGTTGNAFARATAKLGDEGWDMVGEGPLEIRPGQPGGTANAIFYKRRKE